MISNSPVSGVFYQVKICKSYPSNSFQYTTAYIRYFWVVDSYVATA